MKRIDGLVHDVFKLALLVVNLYSKHGEARLYHLVSTRRRQQTKEDNDFTPPRLPFHFSLTVRSSSSSMLSKVGKFVDGASGTLVVGTASTGMDELGIDVEGRSDESSETTILLWEQTWVPM
jgi:hypothetical protein